MIDLKTPKEIAIIKKGGKILSDCLYRVADQVRPGVSTKQLDQIAQEAIKKAGAEPSFLGHENFPAAICVSVNEELVHGLPSLDKIIKNGDIVSLDLGVKYKKLFTDMAITIAVGKVPQKTSELIAVTRQSLVEAVKVIKPGVHLGDVSAAIQQYVEAQGMSVVRSLVGHGVGRKVHEEPRIPNFGEAGNGLILQEGMCLAIEPMVNLGNHLVEVKEDGWTYQSVDKSLTAHFEKTIAVTKTGHQILTPDRNE
ncbi:type I methionyl aminopeptidase [Patescibacteria group bacterium]|nr:type I methionyl aminopeptidase [Patescibacteria group bacterium]